MEEKQIFSDEEKLENLLPAAILLKKGKTELFRLKKNVTAGQLGMSAMKEEEQKQ